MSSMSLHKDVTADKALHEDISTETFEQCKNLMYQYVWKFYNRYGGDFNDWVSEGHLIFMKCIVSYNNKYAFTTWFTFKLQKGFISVIRKKLAQSVPNITYNTKLTKALNPAYHTTFFTRREQVSDRTWTLHQVIQYPPRELDGEIDADDPINTLDAIMWYCATKFQWTKLQVLESLIELWECSQL